MHLLKNVDHVMVIKKYYKGMLIQLGRNGNAAGAKRNGLSLLHCSGGGGEI